MPLQLFALVRRPEEGPPVLRGLFTTRLKAQNHDPMFRGMWEKSQGKLGVLETHRGSLVNYTEIVPYFPNEELKL